MEKPVRNRRPMVFAREGPMKVRSVLPRQLTQRGVEPRKKHDLGNDRTICSPESPSFPIRHKRGVKDDIVVEGVLVMPVAIPIG